MRQGSGLSMHADNDAPLSAHCRVFDEVQNLAGAKVDVINLRTMQQVVRINASAGSHVADSFLMQSHRSFRQVSLCDASTIQLIHPLGADCIQAGRHRRRVALGGRHGSTYIAVRLPVTRRRKVERV